MIVFYILLGLIVGILVAAAFMPAAYTIEKATIIHKPLAEVITKVGNLHFYSQWNPWQKMDPEAEKSITGIPLQAGHRYSWKGKKIGIGNLTLQQIDERAIHFVLQFIKPFNSKANDDWHFEVISPSETKVTWQNRGRFAWPTARLMGPMIMRGLHKQFDKGIANLKAMCEAA